VRYLTSSLRDLGHDVEVISGPPYPELDAGIKLIKLPSLDLYSLPERQRFFVNRKKLHTVPNLIEWLGACTGFFIEPLTFGMRAHNLLRGNHLYHKYDVVHDNQSLSYSIPRIQNLGIPVVTTIHHPIAIDRDLAIKAARSLWEELGIRRWYAFANMQVKVAKRLSHFITGSQNSYREIIDVFGLPKDSLRVIYDGVDSSVFTPASGLGHSQNRLLVVNSGDTPLKGLKYLLEAVAALRSRRDIQLVIVGKQLKNGYAHGLINDLGIANCVTHLGHIDTAELVRQYSMSTIAVVPSIYEGFGLPAAEAMCCGTPVISTTAGALPEIVGDAGVLVPPADTQALTEAIAGLLDNPDRARHLGVIGRKRVMQMFDWKNTAKNTVDVYNEAIECQSRLPYAIRNPVSGAMGNEAKAA
jgi:glycosyltransferase involved in cell wall biosynthesis